MLAQAACAFYWFNPLVWHASKRLRIERETACDDFVITVGAKPSVYAGHLLEIARLMQERSVFEWSQTASVAMARRSQLEGRLLDILSEENERGVVSQMATVGLIALITVLLLSLAVVRPIVVSGQKPTTSEISSSAEEKSLITQTSEPKFLTAPEQHEEEDFINEMAAVGYANLSIDDIIKLKTSNVTPDYVRALRAVGFANLPVKDISALSVYGVTPDYIQSIRAAGYNELSPKELISLQTRGITSEFIREARSRLGNISLKKLISLKKPDKIPPPAPDAPLAENPPPPNPPTPKSERQ
jgi:hypothetical protein